MRIFVRSTWLWALCVVAAMLTAALATPSARAASPAPLPAAGVRQTPVGGASPSGATCHNFYLPVSEHPGEPRTYKVWAQLCSRGGLSGKPVQVLVPGGAYTHVYWDWPSRPHTYSYVDTATRAGYATLNVDKLGYGLSDHPPLPVGLDYPTGAYVIHQVVQDLRAGSLGTRFSKVITNGHSMGGLTIEDEAADFHDVDGLIVSGFAHDLNVPENTAFLTATTLAPLDPAFAGKPWAPGYLTTKSGTRCDAFSYPGDVDPTNCRVEERTKGTFTQGEFDMMIPDSYDVSTTKRINVPVLWALGINDNLWCPETHNCNTSPAVDREKNFWQPGLLTEYVVPRSGHSINVDLGAPAFYARSLTWLRQHHL